MLGGPEKPESYVNPVTSPVLRDPKGLYVHKRGKTKAKAESSQNQSNSLWLTRAIGGQLQCRTPISWAGSLGGLFLHSSFIQQTFIEYWLCYQKLLILLSRKKEWNNAFCSNMDGPRGYHTKWSKPDRERQISYDTAYMWNLKNDTNELIYKTDIDDKLMVNKGERGGGIN